MIEGPRTSSINVFKSSRICSEAVAIFAIIFAFDVGWKNSWVEEDGRSSIVSVIQISFNLHTSRHVVLRFSRLFCVALWHAGKGMKSRDKLSNIINFILHHSFNIIFFFISTTKLTSHWVKLFFYFSEMIENFHISSIDMKRRSFCIGVKVKKCVISRDRIDESWEFDEFSVIHFTLISHAVVWWWLGIWRGKCQARWTNHREIISMLTRHAFSLFTSHGIKNHLFI